MEHQIWIKYFKRTYIQHEASPLLHTKVLEAEPIVELVNGAFVGSSRWIPPRLNGSISKVNFFQGCGFFVPITKGFVLIMEFWCDQLLGVFVKS